MAETQITANATAKRKLARLVKIPILAASVVAFTSLAGIGEAHQSVATGGGGALEPEGRRDIAYTVSFWQVFQRDSYFRRSVLEAAIATPARRGTTLPDILARRQQVPKLLIEGEKLVRQGEVKRALAAYAEAEILSNSMAEIPANSWNALCWYGSLWGYAAQIVDACDKAVAKAPDSEEFRDSRGLARALAGDAKGAIEDFQAFVNATKDDERKYQRQSWINALRIGQNPFTPELIKELFRE